LKEAKYGVIYPVLRKHANRILRGKNVFCKYVGRGVPNLDIGSRILFYVSHSNFEVVGEGKISKLEYMPPSEILMKYSGRLFLSRKELGKYRGNRPLDRKLLVATLSNIRRFRKPVRRFRPLTMAGETLTSEQYQTILKGTTTEKGT
jgi:hypothetical protein